MVYGRRENINNLLIFFFIYFRVNVVVCRILHFINFFFHLFSCKCCRLSYFTLYCFTRKNLEYWNTIRISAQMSKMLFIAEDTNITVLPFIFIDFVSCPCKFSLYFRLVQCRAILLFIAETKHFYLLVTNFITSW